VTVILRVVQCNNGLADDMTMLVKLLILVGVAFAFPDKLRLPELKNGGVHWAFLVAGSNGWMNYRHQVKY